MVSTFTSYQICERYCSEKFEKFFYFFNFYDVELVIAFNPNTVLYCIVSLVLQTQQTRQVLYQSKYGRFGAADPFTALQRDSEKVTDDNFDHNQVSVFLLYNCIKDDYYVCCQIFIVKCSV